MKKSQLSTKAFLQTNLLIINLLFMFVTFTLLILLNFNPEYLIYFSVYLFLATIFRFVFTQRKVKRSLEYMKVITASLENAAKGRIYDRLSNTKNLGEVGQTAWAFNDLMDTVEAYFRETEACFDAVAKSNFNRRPFIQGLPSYFAKSLQKIDASIDIMQQVEEITQKNKLASSLHQLNTKNLLTNLSVSQSDLMLISKQIQKINKYSTESQEKSQQSAQQVHLMADSSGFIQSSMTQVQSSLAALEGSQQSISDAMKMITDITDQTTLLALNASIEAARAGEHGRGFAVVADEVKALSYKTKKTAEQISKNLKIFGSSMSQVTDAMDRVNESSTQIVESIEQVSDSVQVAEHASVQSARLVRHAENQIYASLIKIDHIIYKQHAYRVLGDSNNQNSITIIHNDHHQCRFGQWYDQAETQHSHRDNGPYHTIDNPHRLVHQSVINAYQSTLGDTPNEATIMQHMEDAESASNELIDLLSDLVEVQNDDNVLTQTYEKALA